MRAPENIVQIFNTRWRISPEERGTYSCNKSWKLFVSLAEAKIIYQIILICNSACSVRCLKAQCRLKRQIKNAWNSSRCKKPFNIGILILKIVN
jgi:hypothetical protein